MLSKKFISATNEYCTYEKPVSSPYFKRVFHTVSPKKAELNICGLGFYELYINGVNITKGILAPYISNPDHIYYYDSYDILPFLNDGENVMVVQLGNGMQNAMGGIIWDFDIDEFRDVPKLAFSLEINDRENGVRVIEADENVLCKDSPIWFDDLRSGCFYNANNEDDFLHTSSFEGWRSCFQAKTPKGEAMICTAESIRCQREIKPISIKKTVLGEYHPATGTSREHIRLQNTKPEYVSDLNEGYLYDFGENISGIVRLKIKGNKNQKVELQFCERIDSLGRPSCDNIYFYPEGYSQKDIYICKGESEEIFEPQFTYHGFRYCVVMGITEQQATEDLLTALVYSSDFEKRSNFRCSDDIANTLYDMMLRSDLSNFYYFPTDCPHREKNGWTGDANVSSEHLLMNFACEESLSVWLDNIMRAQNVEGEIPGIVPTGSWGYGWLNGPAWDRVIVELPYRIYQFTGRTDVFKKMYPCLLKYIDFLKTKQDERGLIGYGLGDWMQPEHGCDKPDAPVLVTDSILCMDFAAKTDKILEIIGVEEPRKQVKKFYNNMRTAIRKYLVDFDSMTVYSNCQTAQAMGIYYGVFEPEELPNAEQALLNLVRKADNHFDCGMLGLRVIFHTLADMGKSELAYQMITRQDFPSYRYFIEQGLTTFPEMIKRDYRDNPGSLNHHYFGDIGAWFIRYITGIRVDENLSLHKTVKIQPNFIKALNFAKADYKTPSGKIEVSWERVCERVTLKISAPDDITVETVLPDGYKVIKTGEYMWELEEAI